VAADQRDDQRFACRVKLWIDFDRLSQQLLRAQHVLAAARVHERGRTQLAIARGRIRCAEDRCLHRCFHVGRRSEIGEAAGKRGRHDHQSCEGEERGRCRNSGSARGRRWSRSVRRRHGRPRYDCRNKPIADLRDRFDRERPRREVRQAAGLADGTSHGVLADEHAAPTARHELVARDDGAVRLCERHERLHHAGLDAPDRPGNDDFARRRSHADRAQGEIRLVFEFDR
jgi:hypothetical protein